MPEGKRSRRVAPMESVRAHRRATLARVYYDFDKFAPSGAGKIAEVQSGRGK